MLVVRWLHGCDAAKQNDGIDIRDLELLAESLLQGEKLGDATFLVNKIYSKLDLGKTCTLMCTHLTPNSYALFRPS